MKLSWKPIVSVALVVVPILLLILQQVYGWLPLVLETDATWFTILCGVGISAGFSLLATGPRHAYRNFMLALALLLGIPLLVGGIAAVGDAANGTTITGDDGLLFALNTIGTQVAEWGVIAQIITSLIPAAAIVVGIVLIYMADTPDEYQTAIIETLLVVGVLVLSSFAFGWLGVTVF